MKLSLPAERLVEQPSSVQQTSGRCLRVGTAVCLAIRCELPM